MSNMALTRMDIEGHLVKVLNSTRQDSKLLVEAFFATISDSLAQGEPVKLSGFGSFMVRSKNERPGRNPRTGEAIPVKARHVVTFKAGQKLKEQLDKQMA
jgi:integration host factor subunit alpha